MKKGRSSSSPRVQREVERLRELEPARARGDPQEERRGEQLDRAQTRAQRAAGAGTGATREPPRGGRGGSRAASRSAVLPARCARASESGAGPRTQRRRPHFGSARQELQRRLYPSARRSDVAQARAGAAPGPGDALADHSVPAEQERDRRPAPGQEQSARERPPRPGRAQRAPERLRRAYPLGRALGLGQGGACARVRTVLRLERADGLVPLSGQVVASAFLPWLCAGAHLGRVRTSRALLLCAVAAALQLLSGTPEIGACAFALAGLLALSEALAQRAESAADPLAARPTAAALAVRVSLQFLLAAALGAGLSAIQLFPSASSCGSPRARAGSSSRRR